jgi:type 1 glutamine amidotransferase
LLLILYGQMANKVCAIVGDYYHDPETTVRALDRLPERERYEFVIHRERERFPKEAIEKSDILLLARMGRLKPEKSEEFWISESDERFIFDFVGQGGGLLALHAALASYPPDGPLHALLHGRFLYHPPLHPAVHYVISQKAREITMGADSFTVEDEQYFVELEAGGTEIQLMSQTREHGESPAGWTHECGAGRVCVLLPGHTETAMLHPMMQRLLQNALDWCLIDDDSDSY